MEASIPGIAHVDYHTTKTVHRVAVVGGISSVGPGTEMFLAALKHISQTFTNLSLIACYIDFAHPKDSDWGAVKNVLKTEQSFQKIKRNPVQIIGYSDQKSGPGQSPDEN